jgi:RNA polymerase sigma factor (sigma-70 family)
MSSDDRLVGRASRGDRRAFEAIYRRYHQDLYRFCLAMVGNPQDAQEALQNTMVKVLRALPGEERAIQLKPWLYRIARNEAVEVLRRRHDSRELEPEQAAVGGVAETAEARDRLRLLLADLEELPERQRAALVMRELAGLDFAQIGAAFETSAAVARQTLYEARLSLRQLEEGREMRCEEVMRELSDADGRVTRRREIRAHLRGCPNCRAFRDDIAKRREGLAAVAPLPLATATGLLHGVLGGNTAASGAAGGGLTGAAGAVAGKVVATSAIVKSATTLVVVAAVGASAADPGGLIDLPFADKGRDPGAQSASPPHRSGAAGDAAPGGRATAAPDGTGATRPEPSGGSATRAAEGRAAQADDGVDASPKANTGRHGSSSGSQAGSNPPGGGFGSSASQRHGQPDQLPDAATHGQGTADSHKPAGAAEPPGQSAPGANRARGKPPGGGNPSSPKPTPPPKAEAPVAASPSPDAPAEPSGPGKGKGPPAAAGHGSPHG